MNEIKPLRDWMEMDKLFPNHALYRQHFDEIQAVRLFLNRAQNGGPKNRLCRLDSNESGSVAVYVPLDADQQERLIFHLFGINYTAWLAERAQFLDQMVLRWEAGQVVRD